MHAFCSTGIRFYHEVGELVIGTKGGEYMRSIEDSARKTDLLSSLTKYDYTTMKKVFPDMEFAKEDVALHHKTNSGYINPRKMVAAQIKVAQNNGCRVVRDVVMKINSLGHFFHVKTQSGKIILAKKILLATGAFTTLHPLMKEVCPSFIPMPQTVTLAEVSEDDAEKLKYVHAPMPK